ncbi:MAG: hypothetical protein ACE5PT_04900 [Gemmatimonadales bacterium]
MRLRLVLRVGLLVLAFALGTAGLGWWTVPLLGLAWGGISAVREKPGRVAASAAGIAWAALFAWAMLTTPAWELAAKVGGAMGLPGPLLLLVALGLPMAIAGTGAYVVARARDAVMH